MHSYIVLARKWRPAQFPDIVGQTHIVRTLTNAIRLNRLHQAYLFTGSRGIGKTSIARIFAKVLRCEKTRDENNFIQSCDECSSCKEIAAGNSVDVLEIDGASNNGVEAIREIRENVAYLPSSGKRKIYIIDEVHMLTTAAFNALLKTLEEPPAHITFIFATTEPHKIPATILSRCQRFDYRRVTLTQIQARLNEITKAEGIKTEAGALALISRAAEGSLRDALSLLDQVIAFSGSQISVQSVRESIGLIEGQVVLGVLTGIFNRKPLEALALVDQAYQRGHDLRVFTRSLIEFLHGALLAKIESPHPVDLEFSEEEWKELEAIARLRSLEEMELIFQVLHHGMEWVARSPQPRIVLDVLLIKCATAETLIYVNSSSEKEDSKSTSLPAALPERVESLGERTASTPPQPLIAPVAPSSAASKTGAKTWESFIEHVRKSRPLLAAVLEHSSGTKLPSFESSSTDKTVSIYFSPKEEYYREQIQSRVYQEQLTSLLRDHFGSSVRFQVELRDTGESVAARKEREQKERTESIREKAKNNPIILEAKSLFGGELGPIEVRDPKNANPHLPK